MAIRTALERWPLPKSASAIRIRTASQSEPTPSFSQGNRAEIYGLSKKPELNGSTGWVTGRGSNGRWAIAFEQGGKPIVLRTENIRTVEAAPASAMPLLKAPQPNVCEGLHGDHRATR